MMKKEIIAIDGPAGAGKSTIAKLVAARLGYAYLDTGAMYRCVTLAALAKASTDELTEVAVDLAPKIKIDFCSVGGVNRVYLDGADVTEAIRSSSVTAKVSTVAAVGAVREAMVARQQEIGRTGGVVMDGRDIGTVVFPEAKHKIFLTATAAERARRRYRELTAKGEVADLAALTIAIAARDKADTERTISPLRQAEDAYYLDSSTLSIEEVVDAIMRYVERDEHAV